MKKPILVFVVASLLAACGGSTSTEVKADSTKVAADTIVVAVDSAKK